MVGVAQTTAPPPLPPAAAHAVGDLRVALRAETYTVAWLNVSRPNVTNLSFVPPLSARSALPAIQHLGDVTLRVRPAAASSRAYDFFRIGVGSVRREGGAAAAAGGELVAHDITPLLEATRADGAGAPAITSPLKVRRAYRATAKGAFELSFELTNVARDAIEVGAFGMSVPSAVSQDVHIGGAHGWVEMTRVHIADSLEVDSQCMIVTPLDAGSALENWRPIFEFGGGGYEWAVHTRAWADEWERNVQWPYLYMSGPLNATGLFPAPRSPWPGWGDGGATVRTNVTASTHWNKPTSKTLAPGDSVTYGLRVSVCDGGPRTRDAALAAAGEPVLVGVPGYTLSTDMEGAELIVTPPPGVNVTAAASSAPAALKVVGIAADGGGRWRVALRGIARGRARVSVRFGDGSAAVAHYVVLPPLPTQISRLTHHWSEVAWLPADYPDPFGRGASVMPWDREDGRHRFDDGRAYDVGLSDDAGAASNLGLASALAYAPSAAAVARLDSYVALTLYGTKPGWQQRRSSRCSCPTRTTASE